jgi:hypothetical protein
MNALSPALFGVAVTDTELDRPGSRGVRVDAERQVRRVALVRGAELAWLAGVMSSDASSGPSRPRRIALTRGRADETSHAVVSATLRRTQAAWGLPTRE